MIDYEKAYKEALERAKNGKWDEYTPISRVLKEVFPVLAESEDERIRKEIIESIEGNMSVIHKDKCIDWLKRRGELTVIYDKDTYNSAKEKAWNCKSFSNNINNKTIYTEGFKDGYQFGIHEEKPHRWTLHDEAVRRETIACLLEWKKKFPSIDSIDYENIMGWLKDELSVHTEEKQNEQNSTWTKLDACIKWLNSLKDEYAWKPSELDINLLEMIANGKSNPQDFQASLGGLIGQLKKLKGE